MLLPSRRRYLGALLIAATLAGSARAQPISEHPKAQFSSRFTVELSGQPTPMLERYDDSAEKLDDDEDGVIRPDEFAVWAEKLPGGLRVDLDDFTLGLAHEFTGTLSSYLSGYPATATIEAALQSLAGRHPERVSLLSTGTTPEGRTIWAVRLKPADDQQRPKLAIVAQQHAREWMAHQVALAALQALLEDPANADLLDTFEFWIVPLANPDGYEYSRLVDPTWRKNRRVIEKGKPVGADLNRNFDAKFRRSKDSAKRVDDDWGASDRPYSHQYRGPGPASEPETRDLQRLLEMPGLLGVVDVHGFGCKVVIPDKGTVVDDERYKTVSSAMVAAMGPDYETIRFGDLYPITGSLASYADERGVLGITLEIGKSFQPHPSKIPQVTEEAVRGLLAFARSQMPPRIAADTSRSP